MTYEGQGGGWQLSGGADDGSEGHGGVGELGSQDTVHVSVEALDFEVSPHHVEGLVVGDIDVLQGLGGSQENINNDVGLSGGLKALVDSREDIDSPDDTAIEVAAAKDVGGREDSGVREGGEHNVVQGLSEQVLLVEVSPGSVKDIGDADNDRSVHGGNEGELGLEEALESGVVVETTLEDETLGDTTDPVLPQGGVGGVLPEGLHAGSSGELLTSGVGSEDGSVDSSTGDARHGGVGSVGGTVVLNETL